MKLKAGRWYEDREGTVRGPVVKIPKDDSRWATGMRFGVGDRTWNKRGYFGYHGPSQFDLIREVPAPSAGQYVPETTPGKLPGDAIPYPRRLKKPYVASSSMNVCHPGGLVELPAADIETDKGMMARILDAAQMTPVGQIGDDSLTSCQKQFYAEKAINDWAVQQKCLNELNAQAMLEPVGQIAATPADPMAELCQSIVTDAANAAQAFRDKAVQDAPEPASDALRAKRPSITFERGFTVYFDSTADAMVFNRALLGNTIAKRKKWGDWIDGPCRDWPSGRLLQVEYGDAGQATIRHRIKKPRE